MIRRVPQSHLNHIYFLAANSLQENMLGHIFGIEDCPLFWCVCTFTWDINMLCLCNLFVWLQVSVNIKLSVISKKCTPAKYI
jgi:hypothetical protein